MGNYPAGVSDADFDDDPEGEEYQERAYREQDEEWER